ncbi:acyl-CoA dehydrogenase [Reticulomyxa filosa]|uniref:Acyl-CoA dehydrogenase n=1 Tax=Reticulomyxa filosa TaxID=46433 RepID=X6M9Z5_RETFI|nr:acyl-CoA dehydrogenase [Reticulomyxa filosa]|eukprot:ETO10461.1 acyl-CoA dehydrogenase [Reticulomyxa filosa]
MSGKKEKKANVPNPNAPLLACNWEDQPSPYYNTRHKNFRQYVRTFVNKEIMPYIDKWEADQDVPFDFYKKAYNYGIYATFYPKSLGGTPFEQTKEEEEAENAVLKGGREHRGDAFMTVSNFFLFTEKYTNTFFFCINPTYGRFMCGVDYNARRIVSCR